MYFEDGFKYNLTQTTDIIKWAFLLHINQVVSSKSFVVSGNKLIESALKKLEISSFDFINDNNISLIENAFLDSFKFLIENELISSEVNSKDKFYKFFARKQLFSSREFSNEFDDNLVLTLIYKLDVSFHYIVSKEFNNFYKTYLTHNFILSATKIVTVNLPKQKPVNILALPKHITVRYLKKAIDKYDYTQIAHYISNYEKKNDMVVLFTTKPIEDNDNLLQDLSVTINIENELKKELMC